MVNMSSPTPYQTQHSSSYLAPQAVNWFRKNISLAGKLTASQNRACVPIGKGKNVGERGLSKVLLTDLNLVLEQLAPACLARMGDEPHWQGPVRTSVSKLAVCVDSTEENLRLAGELGVDAIVSHHGWDGTLPDLIEEKQIAIYKCHTNWDRAPGGNSVVLAERLGLQEIIGFNYSAVGNCPPTVAADLITRAARLVGRRAVPYLGDPLRQVSRVGVMAGACFGPGFEDEWAELLRRGAEIVLSGDMSQRVGRSFVTRGVIAVDIGHSSSELPGMERLAELLRERLSIPVVTLRDYYRLEVAIV